jgi:hypothetical protein
MIPQKSALSVKPALAWAICKAGLRRIPRDFAAEALVGAQIAIHASKLSTNKRMASESAAAARSLVAQGIPAISFAPNEAPPVIWVMANPEDESAEGHNCEDWVGGGIVAIATIAACEAVTGWIAPWVWVLDYVIPLPVVIPCDGARGVWTMPREIIAELETMLTGKEATP